MINIEELLEENNKLKKENDLLKEELKELKDGIIGVYNNMNALEIINKKELEEDIEENINKKRYEDYKSRIEKVVEYIEKHSNSFSVLDTISNGTLLNILNGRSDE